MRSERIWYDLKRNLFCFAVYTCRISCSGGFRTGERSPADGRVTLFDDSSAVDR